MSAGRQPPDSLDATALKISPRHLRWLIVALVAAIVLMAFFLRDEFTDIEDTVRTLGYPAIFLASLIGAAGMVVPLPSTAAVFFGGAILTPVYVGLISGVGEAIGEITGYALGYSGHAFVEKNRVYVRVERWVRRYGWAVVFLAALIPNPLFDVLGIAAGALRYPLRRFLLVVWAGKTVKNLGIAYAGMLGADWIISWTGVSISN